MSKTRFTQWVVLGCMGTLAACTSGGGDQATNTEMNVLIDDGTANPVDVQSVEYTIVCDGGEQGPGFLDDGATFADAVTLNGNLEVDDNRDPEVWQGFMDIPPGECRVQLRAKDGDGEVVCSGDNLAAIDRTVVADAIALKVNIILVCDVSFQAPVGGLDVDGIFSFVVGNFCPDLFQLNCLDSAPTVPSYDVLPVAATYCETRARDGDAGCGQGCDPQVCVENAVTGLLDCSPANPPVNPSTGNPLAAAPNGLKTTVTCGAGALLDCTGDLTPDGSCVFNGPLLGTLGEAPPIPIAAGGPGPVDDGGGFYIACDPAGTPGATVSCSVQTTDGDADCDKIKTVDIKCPGLSPCDEPTAPVCDGSTELHPECVAGACDDSTGTAVCVYSSANQGGGCGTNPGAPNFNGTCNNGVCEDFGCGTDADCDTDNNDCTVAVAGDCQANGTCLANTILESGEICSLGGGISGTCELGGVCTGLCTGVDCTPTNQCQDGSCDPADGLCDFVNDDTNACDTCGGASCVCEGGSCNVGLVDPPSQTVEVPMTCRNSFTNVVSDIPIGLVVDPTIIQAGQPFSATVTPTLSFTVAFLNNALIQLPTLTGVAVNDANATVQALNATGANVFTVLAGTPCVVTPTNANGCPDIPLDLVTPPTSPPTVASPLFVELETVSGTWTAGASGQVCFDSFGTIPPAPISGTTPVTDTFLKVFALNVIAVVLACEPGTANPGPPEGPSIPNTDADRNCFNIQ